MTTRRVPERARLHILANPKQRPADAAAALGVTPRTVWAYRNRLKTEGYALPRLPLGPVVDPLNDVIERVSEASIAAVAATCNVRPGSVHRRLARHGLTLWAARRDRVYSTGDLARIFGLSAANAFRTIRAWRAAGLRTIPGTRKVAGRGALHLVTAIALQEFLEHPQCPLDPARIVDPAWREYAVAARAGKLRAPEPAPPPAARCPICERPVSRRGRKCVSCARRER